MTLSPGTLINNRFRIVSILGQGGMGAVYCAKDENLGILVAVKENLFLSDEYSRQFQRETSILASLRCSNLPRVVDYFNIPGQGQYLVMDYIDGEDLRQRIERLGTLPEREVILIGVMICDALAYLHSRDPQVVHRDIKPGNIKITPEGEVFLVDFGLAKLMEDGQATSTGARAMTPGYSPPEQYGTARTDPRSDVYSLGATLYAALTGIIPEDGLARATGKAELTEVRDLQPRTNRRLAGVIERALAVEPEDRFQDAREFKKALLEAGELSHLSQPRITVSPPPATPIPETIGGEPDDDSGKKVEGKPPVSRPAIPGRRARLRRLRLGITWASMLLVVGLVVFSYLRPDLPTGFVGRFLATVYYTPPPATLPVVLPSPLLTTTPAPSLALPTDTPFPASVTPPLPTATVVVVGGPTPTGGGMGQVAFVSNRTGMMQVFIMDSTGDNERQVTTMSEGACQPAWSPDGTRLAVVSPCSKKEFPYYRDARIYIVNADGSNPELLPVGLTNSFDPAWSPDGTQIAFTSLDTGVAHVYMYTFASQTLDELSDSRFADMMPAWNPSGKQLAIVRKEEFFYHIYMMSVNGQLQFQFSSSGPLNDYWPVWSSDGTFLIFSRAQDSPFLPYLVSLGYEQRGTGQEARIPGLGTPGDAYPVYDASLSPDMQWIAYESWPDGKNHDIYLMSINGSSILRMTTDPGYDFDAAWRPGVP